MFNRVTRRSGRAAGVPVRERRAEEPPATAGRVGRAGERCEGGVSGAIWNVAEYGESAHSNVSGAP